MKKTLHWFMALTLMALTSCGNDPITGSLDLTYKDNALPKLTIRDTKEQLTLLFHGISPSHLEKVRNYYGSNPSRVVKEFKIDANVQCEDLGFTHPFEGSTVKQPPFSKDFAIISYAKMTQMCSLHMPTLQIDKGDLHRGMTVPFSPFDLIPFG